MPELTATQLANAVARTSRARSSSNWLVMNQLAAKANAARSALWHICRAECGIASRSQQVGREGATRA